MLWIQLQHQLEPLKQTEGDHKFGGRKFVEEGASRGRSSLAQQDPRLPQAQPGQVGGPQFAFFQVEIDRFAPSQGLPQLKQAQRGGGFGSVRRAELVEPSSQVAVPTAGSIVRVKITCSGVTTAPP